MFWRAPRRQRQRPPQSSPPQMRLKPPLEFSFILCQIDISDSYWLHIDFRFISDCSLKNRKNFRFQISSDWLQNESLWIFAELSRLWKFPENTEPIFAVNFLLIFVSLIAKIVINYRLV